MTGQRKSKPKPDSQKHKAVADSAIAFPIVGIGASAGGLAAFEAFFSGMPTDKDPGMAFVLVQHLAPDHKSILTDLVRRYTRMQVFEVEDGMTVHPNCTYIIPPGRDMAFCDGTLQLLEPSAPRGRRMPIDFFFRSLAQDQRQRAIGIILSGTGSDGTLGVRAIKGEGGMVLVQSPGSTSYDGMPRSALATGLVDYELPPAEMPARILAYGTHAFGGGSHLSLLSHNQNKNSVKKVCVLLRDKTGHDFSQYKPSTIQRRIGRRMAIHQIETIDNYVCFLQQSPEEVEALFFDMLIGVTKFFRDAETFAAVKELVLPKLFQDRQPEDVIRVWSVGCSTGEEAYSLAILLAEHQEEMKRRFKIQVFGTDLDRRSIAIARVGLFPASIAADISPERLARFFSADAEGNFYRVHKEIRDMMIFSEQDVVQDPPFSRIDLICCRNLLIYMNSELQKKIIFLFHYALQPGGFLFLGTSETAGESGNIFSPLDRKSKLYQRRNDSKHFFRDRLQSDTTIGEAHHGRVIQKPAYQEKTSLRELSEQALLQHFNPVAALCNVQGDILYLHGRAGLYLEPTPGKSGVNNVLKMAREGLQRDLNIALHNSARSQKVVSHPNLRVKTNGDFTLVNLTVRPIPAGVPPEESPGQSKNPETTLLLVVFELAFPLPPTGNEVQKPSQEVASTVPGPDDAANACIAALQNELKAKEEYIQTTHEELETANEELRSANEEMQSVNEELQSTNEELETSKEELQSVNEELSTVNAELQDKITDLTRTNNDMNNLLAGTGIATVFVDQKLRILRFTPTATGIINLIPADIGRPVSHIVSNLVNYSSLSEDTLSVLETLVPKEVVVETKTGTSYTMRILPYRTLENVIEGAVITFVVFRSKAENGDRSV
jgi:two-component system CheB/CheR fusion protein